jgi:class 3 adenylate cyclase
MAIHRRGVAVNRHSHWPRIIGRIALVTWPLVTPEETSPSLAAIVAQVDPALPDCRHQTSPDGMMTIVSTDIEGSTELMEQLGEETWLEIIRVHNKLVRRVVGRCGGDVAKSQGDGFMLVFANASSALSCAAEVQHAVRRFNEANHTPSLRVRIGLHTGNVFQLEDDFFGRAVIMAARITGRAGGGQILVSAASKEYTEHLGLWTYSAPRSLHLKGLAAAQCVYSLDWRAEPTH